MLAIPATNVARSNEYVVVSPTNPIRTPARAGPATALKLLDTPSSTMAAGTLSSGMSRGVIERIPPIPRQKNEAAKKPSTKSSQTCGCGSAALTTSPTPVAAIPACVTSRSRRAGGGGEHVARAAAEVGEIDAAALGLLGDPLRKRERLVEHRRADLRLLAHVVQDRALGAGRDDRLGDTLDPDAGAAPAAPVVAHDRLERVDPVGARVLAEAEKDHAGCVRHVRIITEP